MIDNIKECPESHKKYLQKIGLVKVIDDITMDGVTIVGVIFLNDESLNNDYYLQCKKSNIIPMKPHMVKFYRHNLRIEHF
ncbi:hypothetical protein D1872_320330 [compost metagenome]